ncbi:MAG: NepR family anti-sigma factor [Sphingomicrobium sp.]
MSGRHQGEARGIRKTKSSSAATDTAKIVAPEKGARRHRTADLGRALRSVYDDTLRESVPDDFLDLLGKLS